MARNLEEFRKIIAAAERTAQATGEQGFTEPLPSVFDEDTERQLKVIAFGFDKIFGAGRG